MKVACYVSSGGSGRNEAETIGKLKLKKGRIPSQRRSSQTFILSSSVILATVSRLKRGNLLRSGFSAENFACGRYTLERRFCAESEPLSASQALLVCLDWQG